MNIGKRSILFGMLLIFLTGCINIPLGDGELKVTRDGLTVTDEEGEEYNVDIGNDEGQFSISSDEGEISLGASVDIPADFPSDIPLADDAVVVSAVDMEELVAVTYGSEIDINTIDDMYKNYIESSAFENPYYENKSTDGYLLTNHGAERPDGTLIIGVQGNTETTEDSSALVIIQLHKHVEE